MAHIFLNGISAKSGGGRSILTNFLSLLRARGSAHRFSVVVPDDSYSAFAGPDVELLPMPRLSKTILLPFVTRHILPRLIGGRGCDLVLTFADVPIPTKARQIFLFDWSYAAYPESVAWTRAGFADNLRRRSKLSLFRRHLKFVDLMIAQGPAIRDRLGRLYDVQRLRVIPNAVALDNLSEGEVRDFALGAGFKLLCLSHYYSHKNLEIFIDVAERIRERGLDLKIIITIKPSQGAGARRLLAEIERRKLRDIIVNVGPVAMPHVPSLYQQTDALLLPTLLESFSGTYVEAMFHGRPIFTSHYEFAADVCKDAAYYFDPLNADDIVDTIAAALAKPEERLRKVACGRQVLDGLMSWEDAFAAYAAVIEEMLEDRP